MRFSALGIFSCSVLLVACGGGGGGGGALPASPLAPNQTIVTVPSPGIPSPSPSSSPGTGPTPTVLGIAGFKGDTQVAQVAGDTFEYSEDLLVRFSANLSITGATATITPQTTSTVNIYGAGVRIALRKVPGTTYTITVSGVKSQTGMLAQPYTTSLTTAPVTMPPVVVPPASPYRFGVLEHPWSPFLIGSSAPLQFSSLQQSGVGFVRIDYAGSTLEPVSGTFDFSQSDAIATQLAASGITELPVLLQYSPPGWSNANAPYPAMWSQPSDFAAYVGGVVAHLRVSEPQITRVEIFNEPNVTKWWTNANPAYASQNGGPTAAYMLAAYAAAKAANPAIVVVGPALGNGGSGYVDPRTFLSAMYAAGCRTGTCWDVISVHEYAWNDPAAALTTFTHSANAGRMDLYKDIQAIAVAQGDAVPHVMITEWGYTTTPTNTSPLGVDPAVQALYVSKVLAMFSADPTVDGSTYVNMYNPATDYWGYTALVDASGNTKPAFAVLRQYTGH